MDDKGAEFETNESCRDPKNGSENGGWTLKYDRACDSLAVAWLWIVSALACQA